MSRLSLQTPGFAGKDSIRRSSVGLGEAFAISGFNRLEGGAYVVFSRAKNPLTFWTSLRKYSFMRLFVYLFII